MFERQPSAAPTNKVLTMFGGNIALLPLVQPFVAEVWPLIAPAAISGPAATNMLTAVLTGIAAVVIAYFVPDRMGSPAA